MAKRNKNSNSATPAWCSGDLFEDRHIKVTNGATSNSLQSDFLNVLRCMGDVGRDFWYSRASPLCTSIENFIVANDWKFINTYGASLDNHLEPNCSLNVNCVPFKCFVLNRTPGHAVPVLFPRFRFNYDKGKPCYPHIQLNVAIFFMESELTHVKFFRLEPPEGEGHHNYVHMQQSHGFCRNAVINERDVLVSRVETSFPAWPIYASTPQEMLYVLHLSLYGLDDFRSNYSTEPAFVVGSSVPTYYKIAPLNVASEIEGGVIKTWRSHKKELENHYSQTHATTASLEEVPSAAKSHKVFWLNQI